MARPLFLYPGDGATGVSTTIGELIFLGPSGLAFHLSANGGAAVPVAPLQPAPSPLPSPLATPPAGYLVAPNYPGGVVFSAGTIPTLAPATTYTVTLTDSESAETPPCVRTITSSYGSFTTR